MIGGNPVVERGGAVAVEDVLDGDVPAAPARPRRTRFSHPAEYALGALLLVVPLVAGLLVWLGSDFRATSSTTAPQDALTGPPPARADVPAALTEAWRAPSPATWEPVVAGPSVVTGADGAVEGRDPLTGQVRWRYHRDLPLCAVSTAWSRAVAVYRTEGGGLPSVDPRSEGGCSEVSSLEGSSGALQDTRNTDAEPGTRLVRGGSFLTATGTRLLTSWRSDLVKTADYGAVPTPVNPDRQPRTGCAYRSTLAAPSVVAVLERCPDESADRLTVYRTVPKESDTPEVVTSRILPSAGATLVAVTDQRFAVALPAPDRIAVYDEDGIEQASHPLPLGVRDPAPVPWTTTATGSFTWFSGTRTIALSAADLRPLWVVDGARGPATTMAGRALVPVEEGLAVVDQASGARITTIPVPRDGYSGVVMPTTAGPVVLEQRGEQVVALR
ncbi:Rv3212 family protein [Actinokineospora bangkokensis]|uniref:Uncharacterized protein n=1 Tax=Actinokineospora bangkokensis TaxID=1193682 RepID=A0A1Q9LDM8_9PSEU|nr:hypothetical protein [Actinokineospora bangkokensis]OLR90147.1 hypothetical protein BJP25_04025 [Actinokineospora bangkokensis]